MINIWGNIQVCKVVRGPGKFAVPRYAGPDCPPSPPTYFTGCTYPTYETVCRVWKLELRLEPRIPTTSVCSERRIGT